MALAVGFYVLSVFVTVFLVALLFLPLCHYGFFVLLQFLCHSMVLFVLLWFFCLRLFCSFVVLLLFYDSFCSFVVLLLFYGSFCSFAVLLLFYSSSSLLRFLCSFAAPLLFYRFSAFIYRLSCGIALRPATCAADSLTGIPGPPARTVRYLSDSPAISPWTGWIPDRL